MKRLRLHRHRWLRLGAALLALALSGVAQAHKPSDSYLRLHVAGETVQGQWDIALRDLALVLALDGDGNGAITWGEVKARHEAIAQYALARLSIRGDGAAPCPATAQAHLLEQHSDGTYAVLRFTATCPRAPAQLVVEYRLLFELDALHRGLLQLVFQPDSQPGAATASAAPITQSAVFAPETTTHHFRLAEPGRFSQFADYFRSGVWHIWIGFDHILFLLSLLLPAVLTWHLAAWQPAARFRYSAIEVLRVVTAFTIAHSLTLSLAVLGVIALPSRLVESAIALSVILAALNNLWPWFHGRRWAVAFVFGLIHGLGFANVLRELDLQPGVRLLALAGFNLGVEGGQLALVAVFLPLAFLMRTTPFYQRGVFRYGSAAIALLAGVWLVERAADWKVLPDG